MDIVSEETRSYIMSQIRSKDTKPELIVRKALFAKGFRYRIHDKRLPGKPDIVLPKYKTVIFVNGCFWHGHDDNCPIYKPPKSNVEFWQTKIKKNKNRDIKNIKLLKELGWKVITIWECSLKGKSSENILNMISDISQKLKKTMRINLQLFFSLSINLYIDCCLFR